MKNLRTFLLKLTFSISLPLVFAWIGQNSTFAAFQTEHPTFAIDFDNLKGNRSLLTSGDSEMEEAVKELIQEAESSLKKPMRSVVEKRAVSGIKDKHDFVSMGPYWWPDPEQKDGLPYIRKDGRTNPEGREITDKAYFAELSDLVYKLGLTYFYTSDEKYADNAIKRLQVWFLDEKTKMNPNLNHGQYIPGRNMGRAEGVIDTRIILPLIDGIQLLKSSPSWTEAEEKGISRWFSDFLSWFETSELGIVASQQENNIGTAYYMQVIQMNLFLGRDDAARNYLRREIPGLLDSQIEESGAQRFEIRRTNSWNYSVLNLNYWFNMANMAEHVGVDLWNYRTPTGKSLNTAFEWLLPYALNQKDWERTQLRKVDLTSSFNNIYQISKDKFKTRFLFFKTRKRYTEFESVYSNRVKGITRLTNRNQGN